jgi:sec-independent protein translocase protein TatA
VEILGVGPQEMIVIAVLAVLLFGDRLPEVARTVAKISKRLKDATREFQDALRLDD